MSLQYCSYTGEPIQDPVVSRKTGHLFEKRIIEKEIQITGQCPITNQPLDLADLISVKQNESIKPRPTNATSIPNMINIMQNEWDTIMLETYNLKTHLETVRQELSHALYQHDAACRVIARVIKERDDARKELSELYQKLGVNPEQVQNGMEIEQQGGGLPQQIQTEVEEKATALNTQRKKNKKDAEFLNTFTPPAVVSGYSPIDQVSLHSTTNPGISCSSVHPEQTNIVATGGIDGSIILYDTKAQKIISTFEAVHKKRVNDVVFTCFDDKIRVFSAGEDGLVSGFAYDLESKQSQQTYSKKYNSAQNSIAVLQINYVFATCGQDGVFSFHDARENKELSVVRDYEGQLAFNSIKIHPDGHFAALGSSDGTVIVWNIFSNNLVAKLQEEGTQEINTLSFSENGYILATGSKKEQAVRIWNLKNGNCINKIQEVIPENICYDLSAQILAVVSDKQIKMYETKKYETLSTTEAHRDQVTSISFHPKSKFFVTTSLDRQLIVHSQ